MQLFLGGSLILNVICDLGFLLKTFLNLLVTFLSGFFGGELFTLNQVGLFKFDFIVLF